ncbi:pseudouridylate synthase RPUSD2-like isoform X2 [Artemia franciscana]|uniref:pseudouridylate synthase RPUSD2-like isoform X2 n=1 Tax=Artemia franciscana TaxID=6661 RepID=UPI0032DAF9F8
MKQKTPHGHYLLSQYALRSLRGYRKCGWDFSSGILVDLPCFGGEKRKPLDDTDISRETKKAKLETRALKAKRPGFSDERYNETDYYFENGLRKVYPYYFTFTTFTKGRWVNEKILDVFAKEFRAHPPEVYERCIKSGSLTVNYNKVDTDYRLRHNDLLANLVHRHERAVVSDPIQIVHMDDDFVVVNKPPSIPVHPCGRYRHNTVVFILAKEHGLKNLRTVHRLDRLTSGLLIFGRTAGKTRELEQQIRTRQVSKEYVCRVEGKFPDDEVICEEPIRVVSYKIGVCKVAPDGKDCRTDFRRLSYNGSTSVVLCKPLTGRMHQIRVHLQYLGYPIVNDPLYNHTVFGPEKGKGGVQNKSDDQLIGDLISIHNAESVLGLDESDIESPLLLPSEDLAKKDSAKTVGQVARPSEVAEESLKQDQLTTQSEQKFEPESPSSVQSTCDKSRITFDENCAECKMNFKDPQPEDLIMYLHALKYSGKDWSFNTPLPKWADENWKEE